MISCVECLDVGMWEYLCIERCAAMPGVDGLLRHCWSGWQDDMTFDVLECPSCGDCRLAWSGVEWWGRCDQLQA